MKLVIVGRAYYVFDRNFKADKPQSKNFLSRLPFVGSGKSNPSKPEICLLIPKHYVNDIYERYQKLHGKKLDDDLFETRWKNALTHSLPQGTTVTENMDFDRTDEDGNIIFKIKVKTDEDDTAQAAFNAWLDGSLMDDVALKRDRWKAEAAELRFFEQILIADAFGHEKYLKAVRDPKDEAARERYKAYHAEEHNKKHARVNKYALTHFNQLLEFKLLKKLENRIKKDGQQENFQYSIRDRLNDYKIFCKRTAPPEQFFKKVWFFLRRDVATPFSLFPILGGAITGLIGSSVLVFFLKAFLLTAAAALPFLSPFTFALSLVVLGMVLGGLIAMGFGLVLRLAFAFQQANKECAARTILISELEELVDKLEPEQKQDAHEKREEKGKEKEEQLEEQPEKQLEKKPGNKSSLFQFTSLRESLSKSKSKQTENKAVSETAAAHAGPESPPKSPLKLFTLQTFFWPEFNKKSLQPKEQAEAAPPDQARPH
jgi:hypothetical protein